MKSFLEPVSPQALEAARNGVAALTPREVEVLRSVVRGTTSAEMAEMLNISPRTADTTSAEMAEMLNISPRTAELHRANIFRKIGAKSAVQAVRLLALLERGPLALLIGVALALLNVGELVAS